MHSAGELPGKGTYKCTNYETFVTLDSDTETLPPCPECGGIDFERV
jgi:hypothetical protein